MSAPDVYTFHGHAVLLERPDGSATALAVFATYENAVAYVRDRESPGLVVKSANVRLEVQR